MIRLSRPCLFDSYSMDVVDKETRSRMMATIRGRDTKPEITVRKYLHNSGFRFRLSPKNILGKPDIVLPKYRTVIFVHGCYWHRHLGCRFATKPKTNKLFWNKKFESNIARDKVVTKQLRKEGWKVLVIWECQMNDKRLQTLRNRIAVHSNQEAQ